MNQGLSFPNSMLLTTLVTHLLMSFEVIMSGILLCGFRPTSFSLKTRFVALSYKFTGLGNSRTY